MHASNEQSPMTPDTSDNQKASDTTSGVGRPRDTRASKAALKAALELAQEGGVSFATIERIAGRSGVAKTTIYRRWPNAAGVVMAAFLQELGPLIEYPDQGEVKEVLTGSISHLVDALNGPRGILLRHLLGEAQKDEALASAFWNEWILPRRNMGKAVLERAVRLGEIRPGTNLDIALDALYGAVYYRLMIPYAPLTQEYVDALVDQALAGIAPQPTKSE